LLASPDTAIVGVPAHFIATLRTGDTSGLSFSWHSTMVANGQATASANDNEYTLTYSRSGLDTVSLIAANPFGTDTQTATVQVMAYYTIEALSNDDLMGTVSGSGSYLEGDTVTLTATANEGFYFSHWSDGDTQPVRRVVVACDTSFLAHFMPLPILFFTVEAVSADSTMGWVTGGGMYAENDTALLTATAYEGYHFVQWNDGIRETERQVIVVSDTLLTAYFEVDTLPIGIGSAPSSARFNLYPNPAKGQVVVSFDLQEALPATLTLLDMAGRKVMETGLTSAHTRLDVSALP
jgi:hypothetical protein